ncbi:MAG: hypothetical protein ACOX0U_10315 [Oscillospiraceae bacterium]|jgi:hypothetical protein
MKAPGKGFLLVCGILFVIFSGISLIVLAIGGSLVGALAGALSDYGTVTAAATTTLVISAIFGLINLAAGIIFIANSNKPEKAMLCLVFAILTIVLQIVSIILYGFTWMSLIGFVLPILCLIGAIKNQGAVVA